jgi:hypothetical protein
MLALLLMMMAQPDDVDAAVAHYRAVTAAAPQCHINLNTTDITVCGRRAADRYRLPLIEHTAGDPKYQGAPLERERLLARTSNCQEKTIFLVGCGKVGMSVGTGGVALGGERPLAP